MRRARRSRGPTGRSLQTIPGIGPRMESDLIDLGYRRVEDLRGADPERMYRSLCERRGMHIDRCVLYTFRCAVYYASTDVDVREPELLKWWTWKDDQRERSGRSVG